VPGALDGSFVAQPEQYRLLLNENATAAFGLEL
jgi:hypothetical protein